MTRVFANYAEQLKAFQAFLKSGNGIHIILFQGEKGVGKTTLLNRCLQHAPANLLVLRLQLRNPTVSLDEIFDRSIYLLGQKLLAGFWTQVEKLDTTTTTNVRIEGSQLFGIKNKITVALNADTPTERQERRVAMTRAWFNDIRALERPFLIAIDDFEKANRDVAQWIEGPFLSRVAQTDSVRVLIAGERVPDRNTIEWGHSCQEYELLGVQDAQEWLRIVKSMGRVIDFGDPNSCLETLCRLFNGRPAEMMKAIEDVFPVQKAGL